jgi:hypothetical protein
MENINNEKQEKKEKQEKLEKQKNKKPKSKTKINDEKNIKLIDLSNTNIYSNTNNIDLLYLTNRAKFENDKKNKLLDTINSNSNIAEIFYDLDKYIDKYNISIKKVNDNILAKITENKNDLESYISSHNNSEKYKSYYLLYVLHLIVYLKQKNLKIEIENELSKYTNISNNLNNSNNIQSIESFDLYQSTLDNMTPDLDHKGEKKVLNLDSFIKRTKNTTGNYNLKILPKKRE